MSEIVHPFIQARQLEQIMDDLHNRLCEELGQDHELSFIALLAATRTFALMCDLESKEI